MSGYEKMNAAISKNNFNIRLTSERWLHITEGHSELAGYFYEVLDTIENPEKIYAGNFNELLAVKEIEKGSLSLLFIEKLMITMVL